jgi:hypothetical protein
MSFHVALLWALLWVTGVIPALIVLYIPIGVAWIIGYGIYLGCKRLWAVAHSSAQSGAAK